MKNSNLRQISFFLITISYEYAYTTGALGSVQSTNTYTYGNDDWGDQLTAFNGTANTYDKIGNPKTYYNGTSYNFLWQNGRKLVSANKSGTTYRYTYDDRGNITQKIVAEAAAVE